MSQTVHTFIESLAHGSDKLAKLHVHTFTGSHMGVKN